MGIREGSGMTTVAVGQAAAFAYLADPRHAPEWFAGVGVAEPPEGAPHEGLTWRFVQPQGARPSETPVRMTVYEPPSRFVWRTHYSWPRTNLAWELRCEPEDSGSAGDAATEAGGSAGNGVTWLTFTIRIEPGPLGWLTLLVAAPFSRDTLAKRAQRAVERARDVLVERAAAGSAAQRAGRVPKRAKPTRKGRPAGKRWG